VHELDLNNEHLLVSIYRRIDDVVNKTTRVGFQKSEDSSLDYRPASYSLSIGRPLLQGTMLEIIADHSLPSFAELGATKSQSPKASWHPNE
jgi:hypothetical protein